MDDPLPLLRKGICEDRCKVMKANCCTCAWAADEIERLRAALRMIADMGDEENEWDGTDRFKRVRGFAHRVFYDGVIESGREMTCCGGRCLD